VTGKINGDFIQLYEGNVQIGHLPLSQVSHLLWVCTAKWINKKMTVTVEPDQKYVDCDGGAGWC
jgi:Protein of unknown function (DUF2553)